MRAAEALIAGAEVAGEGDDTETGVLLHDGDALTSERVTEEIEVTLLRHGLCARSDDRRRRRAGRGTPRPRFGAARADEAIIVDIFPRSKATKRQRRHDPDVLRRRRQRCPASG